ncbi:NUDIX hydrolase [Gordonia sp. C13]|uniref:NUDIX hydrolase n=1 Tax=Gordonia sp. C13 TaxID=2935078 RepID=UPI00200AB59A|nr:NUDIX hydrolase [Gordonia sp. C13]MCK8614319.1 NUDIX hydrolase [Gordonia sp. C13]
MTTRIVAVGAVLTDDDGRVLLIQRRNPPQAGKWTVPGGKVEPGESIEAAVVREMVEETGLRVEVGELLWTVDIPGPDDVVFEVHDFAARVVSGMLCAGDDAADAGWFTPEQLAELPVTRGLVAHLRKHGLLE